MLRPGLVVIHILHHQNRRRILWIWITLLEPVSDQGISILNIPSKIDGKKVTKLGSKYDNDQEYREYNIFGFWLSENDGNLNPKKMINRVEKIKNIVIPETVINVTPCQRIVNLHMVP
jgi:hypothetical protein